MTPARANDKDTAEVRRGSGLEGRPTRLFLVRHGEVEGEGVLHGHVDVALTPRGRRQLGTVAERLRAEPLSAVYCSDLQRSRIGAELVARGRQLPVLPRPAFRELHMGEWDGKGVAELWRDDRERIERWWANLESFALPGGESLSDLNERILSALRTVLAEHREESICLVAHGGVNRVILFEALGLPLSRYHKLAQDYGCLNIIDYYPDGNAVVRLING
jgi:broad specificity phosphatase PhoE